MGLELTTDRYPPITSQTRYPLRHALRPLNREDTDECTLTITCRSKHVQPSYWSKAARNGNIFFVLLSKLSVLSGA